MEQDGYRTFDTRVSPVRAGQDTRICSAHIQPARGHRQDGRRLLLEEGGRRAEARLLTVEEVVQEKFSFRSSLNRLTRSMRCAYRNSPVVITAGRRALDDRPVLAYTDALEEGGLPPPVASPRSRWTGSGFTGVTVPATGSVDRGHLQARRRGRGTLMPMPTPATTCSPSVRAGLVFVLDVSGSMPSGTRPWSTARSRRSADAARIALPVLFNEFAREPTSASVNATPENINHSARPCRWYSRVVAPTCMPASSVASGDRVRSHQRHRAGNRRRPNVVKPISASSSSGCDDVRLFTFISGNSANRPLLKAMTGVERLYPPFQQCDIVGRILEAASKVTHESLHAQFIHQDRRPTTNR